MGDRNKRFKARSGKDPFAYIGVNPIITYRFVVMPGIPNADIFNNFDIGTVWLEEVDDPDTDPIRVYMLVNKVDTTATWKLLGANVGNDLLYLTGNTGARVGSDSSNNINDPSGFSPLTLDGNAGTWTITCNSDGTLATSYPTDTGTAIPVAGVLNVLGGTGGATSGSGSTITVGGTGAAIATQYDADSGSAVPAANVLNVLGSGSISTAAAASTVTITDGAHDPVTYPTDAGTATPAGNILNMLGGLNISTSGAGDTVTVSAADLGGPGVVFTDSGGNFSSENGTDGQVIIAATGLDAEFAFITSADGSVDFTVGANTLDLSAAGAGHVTAGENINLDYPAVVNLNETIHWPDTNVGGTTGMLFLGGAGGAGGARWLHNFGVGTAGSQNTFCGNLAGNLTLTAGTAIRNTCIGDSSGSAITTAANTTALGSHSCLSLTTGDNNTVAGRQVMELLTSGDNNTVVGSYAFRQQVTGSNMTAIGCNNGSIHTSGDHNTILASAESGFSLTTDSNILMVTTRDLGINTSGYVLLGTSDVDASQDTRATYIAGIYGNASVGGVATFLASNSGKRQVVTNTSSRKYKDNIIPITESIEQFRPVTFNYKEDDTKRTEFGLIAEEVLKIFPEMVVFDDGGLPFSVQYNKLIPLLLKELQRIGSRIEHLEQVLA